MENINQILGRDQIANKIKIFLTDFDKRSKDVDFMKGVYIYGSHGSGKTQFVVRLLEEMNYDIIRYDAGDVRNSSMIDSITSNTISNRNVLSMMRKTTKRKVIVMDEIDGMNSGDKGGLSSLIKLIRQKKTKKQKTEDVTLNPIICIGNYFQDKKMRELIKVCHSFELSTPSRDQIQQLLPSELRTDAFLNYIQGDLRKLDFVVRHPTIPILQLKSHNDNAKLTTKWLIANPASFESHNAIISETDRTTIALLWHENIVDVLPTHNAIPLYTKLLNNMCFADYIDRITFQYQIWVFNEISSLMKTMHNNKLFHDNCPPQELEEVRFTKVLTKYSTEYNNSQFIYAMCQKLDMDKKDLMLFFNELRHIYKKEEAIPVEKLFASHDVCNLDIKRIYRYIDKNIKHTAAVEEDDLE